MFLFTTEVFPVEKGAFFSLREIKKPSKVPQFKHAYGFCTIHVNVYLLYTG